MKKVKKKLRNSIVVKISTENNVKSLKHNEIERYLNAGDKNRRIAYKLTLYGRVFVNFFKFVELFSLGLFAARSSALTTELFRSTEHTERSSAPMLSNGVILERSVSNHDVCFLIKINRYFF